VDLLIAIEGDKDLIATLEDFMPRVVHGERPGMVFNVSHGLEGRARYTHVSSILEMVGIPYVASLPERRMRRTSPSVISW